MILNGAIERRVSYLLNEIRTCIGILMKHVNKMIHCLFQFRKRSSRNDSHDEAETFNTKHSDDLQWSFNCSNKDHTCYSITTTSQSQADYDFFNPNFNIILTFKSLRRIWVDDPRWNRGRRCSPATTNSIKSMVACDLAFQ